MAGVNVIRAVIFPEVYGSAAASGVAETTRTHIESTLRPFATLLPPLAGLAALALGPIVGWAMPRYADTIPVAQLFVFAGLAQGLATLTALGIVAADRQRILPLLSLGALLLTVLVSVTVLEAGLGLAGVATGALVGRTVGAVGLIHRLMCIAGLGSPLRTSLGIVLPLAWCSAAVVVVGYAVPATAPGTFALACALYVLLAAPLAPLARAAWAEARQGATVRPGRK